MRNANARREFIKNSSKILLGSVALNLGVSNLLADSSTDKTNAKLALNTQDSKNPALNHTLDSKNSIAQGATMTTLALNNGVSMPIAGFGTYNITGKEATRCVEDAISVGYRLIDTAQMYHNEVEVGIGVRNSGLKRSELFITTKLSGAMDYERAKRSIDESLAKLNLGYIDLLLIHWDTPHSRDMWRAMEEAYQQGKLKAIGVSNFNEALYSEFIKHCKIIPALNQLETHIFYQRQALQDLLTKHGTIMQAWSPFAQGRNGFFKNETLLRIAKKYQKTPAQVALRWLVQRGISVIPKTTKKERMIENINIFDFKLDSSDMSEIARLDTGKSSFGWLGD